MKIQEYGFWAQVDAKQAIFTGPADQRAWTASNKISLRFETKKLLRQWFKKQDLAYFVECTVQMSMHGTLSDLTNFINIFLMIPEGKTLSKKDGCTRRRVLEEVERLIETTHIRALADTHYSGLRILKYRNTYNSAVFYYHNTIKYYAVPMATKKNGGPRFQKLGPKPNPQTVFYKRHRKWN